MENTTPPTPTDDSQNEEVAAGTQQEGATTLGNDEHNPKSSLSDKERKALIEESKGYRKRAQDAEAQNKEQARIIEELAEKTRTLQANAILREMQKTNGSGEDIYTAKTLTHLDIDFDELFDDEGEVISERVNEVRTQMFEVLGLKVPKTGAELYAETFGTPKPSWDSAFKHH